MDEPRVPQGARPAPWFRQHRRYAWVGLLATLLAFGLGLAMWLDARLADQAPAGLLVLPHVLAGLIAGTTLTLAARSSWLRTGRPSLAQVLSRRQQRILEHRLLAFAALVCAAAMALTGFGALLGWFFQSPPLALIYGHLLTGIMLVPLVVAAFLLGLRVLSR